MLSMHDALGFEGRVVPGWGGLVVRGLWEGWADVLRDWRRRGWVAGVWEEAVVAWGGCFLCFTHRGMG